MAGEQTASGRITWKQQAGSVLQQRKIFRSSPTTRQSHFIWPGGCGQWIDTFPCGYTVMHLSIAPSHIFFPLLWQLTSIFKYSSLLFCHFVLFSYQLPPFASLFPSATFPHHIVFSCVAPLAPSPSSSLPFLPQSPSFSPCLWSITLNLAPSICFSSLV